MTKESGVLGPTITELVTRSHSLSRSKGWYDEQTLPTGDLATHRINIGEKLALVHSEISEALETWRSHGVLRRCPDCNGTGKCPKGSGEACWSCNDGFQANWLENGKPEGFDVELADAVIRIADLCGAFGINLAAAIELKHAYNQTRPHRHGGKRA